MLVCTRGHNRDHWCESDCRAASFVVPQAGNRIMSRRAKDEDDREGREDAWDEGHANQQRDAPNRHQHEWSEEEKKLHSLEVTSLRCFSLPGVLVRRPHLGSMNNREFLTSPPPPPSPTTSSHSPFS